MRLALVCFYCLCVFVYVLYFIATMSFAGYFLPVLFCMLSMLISDSRFDLVWFRLSCDHGWIRSGSVNVRKQQTTTTTLQILTLRFLVPSTHFQTRPTFFIYFTFSPPLPPPRADFSVRRSVWGGEGGRGSLIKVFDKIWKRYRPRFLVLGSPWRLRPGQPTGRSPRG